ncbi:MAG: cache domain-containing protein [Melioribacteraceae bacterium]|nr:cache domain-containing protein [Melioribacteraceae bacterium]
MNQLRKNSSAVSYTKILLPTFLTIALFITAIFFVIIPQFENIVIDRKREMIRELTNSAHSMISKWHKLQSEGKISEQEAKSSAINIIRSLRYGSEQKDYFWVTDLLPKMVVHPYRPELDGTNLNNFEDSHGKKLFVEMVEVVKKSSEGYVDYTWQWKDDSLKIVPKLSYVKLFTPWNWVIGTGIYIEDVKDEIARLERKIINISILITILSSLLLFYIAFQNMKSEKRKKLVEDELKESRERYKLLVETSSEGLVMVLDNGQLFYNKTFYSMLGYPETGKAFHLSEIFRTIPKSDIFDFVSLKKLNDNQSFNEKIEAQLIKQNGEFIDAILDLSSISFSNNNGIIISIKDVSINKEIEEALGYEKEKYLALTNQISIGVFRAQADKKLQILEINPALVQLLGAESSNKLINKSLLDYFENQDDVTPFIKDIFTQQVLKNKIIRITKENGTNFISSISAVLVKNSKGENQSIDGIIEDITEQQSSDKEKEKLIANLQSSIIVLSQRIAPYIKKVPICHYLSSVEEAAKLMTAYKSSSIIVSGDNHEEIGIITDGDLRERVTGKNINNSVAVYSIMTAPVVTIKSTASLYDAIFKMQENQIKQLLVKDSLEKLLGILDVQDLFEGSYSNYLFFMENINNAQNVKTLTGFHNYLMHLVHGMIKNNVDLISITKIITLTSDSITKRIINNAIKEIGTPPCNFTFICMGSEGREEQTLSTDQDNAIIFEDVPESEFEITQNYFLKLGRIISDNLNASGYSYCKGQIMSMNVKWCQPLSIWKKYFTRWITSSSPQDLLDLKIFFDFRYVYGDESLTKYLKTHVDHLLKSYDTFFVYLAESILRAELPENILKLKFPIDIKLLLLPVVDFVRLYGLKLNMSTSNTIDRLDSIHEQGVISTTLYNELFFSYKLFMQIRFLHQAELNSLNMPVNNLVTNQNLSEIHFLILKRYMELLKEIKDKINLDFKGTLVR